MSGERRDRLSVVDGNWCSLLSAMALCVLVACVQDSGQPGPPGGPSELGLSLSLTAMPDLLPLDGATHAMIGILARDQHGAAVSNITLLLQIETVRGFEDFGRLSARQVDTGEVVTISVTPVDGNFSNAVSRRLTIRLVPRRTVIPPFSATPGFAFTPATPTVFNDILFTTACATPRAS